jgi:hypothetical protein
MPEQPRLDESLSIKTLEKSLSGKDSVTIDPSKFTVSGSGVLTSQQAQNNEGAKTPQSPSSKKD